LGQNVASALQFDERHALKKFPVSFLDLLLSVSLKFVPSTPQAEYFSNPVVLLSKL